MLKGKQRLLFRKLGKLALVLVCIMVINIGVMVFSYYRYGTYNYIKSGMGIMNILLTDSSYVELQRNPAIYLADKEGLDELLAYLEEEGLALIPSEGAGAMEIFQKGEEQYIAYIYEGSILIRVRFEKNPM